MALPPRTRERFDMSQITLKQRRAKLRGFTLLELLLALVIMVALLTATWMLLGIFRDRVEKAQTQTERRHLTRALQLTLSNDLRNRLQPLPDTSAAASLDSSSHGTAQASTSDIIDPRHDSSTPPALATANNAPIGPAAVPVPSNLSVDRPLPMPPLVDDSSDGQFRDHTDSRDFGESDSQWSDPIATGEWKSTERFLLGTAQSLRFDVIPPAAPDRSTKPTEPPNLENAAIPDVIHRIVYVFSDPALSGRGDRPPGLVRAEFTTHQLLDFANLSGESSDLLTFLRPTLQLLAPEGLAALSNDLAANTTAVPLDTSELPPEMARFDQNDAPIEGRAEGATTFEPPPEDPQGLLQHVDYAPEVAAFLLRYYDGNSWTTSWDSRQHAGRWPVAIELRFQLVNEISTSNDGTDNNAARTAADTGTGGNQFEPPQRATPLSTDGANPLEPQADELRSAQTEPINDHRYIIPF